MKKTVMIAVIGFLSAAGLKAQTLQEGVNHLYADRFKSAVSVFEKLLAANPNNIEATYWLGQTYLDMDKNDLARQLYDKALTASSNAPLVLVGRGHVDLLDKKAAEARQKFETAITMTRTKKGDDPVILNAVGRANVDAKEGDLAYAVTKLEDAVKRDDKNAEIYLNLGNAYRKAKPGEGGGQAFQNYKKALDVNPNFAVAYIRLAKLFEAQRNGELYLENLNKAVEVDTKFSLGYYELFYYYFFRQKYEDAEGYLKKFIDSKQPETYTEDQRMYAELCWARKDYTCAITKAENIITEMGEQTKPKVLKLLADSYLQKGDFENAKKYVDWYFKREKSDELIAFDYELKADIYSKIAGQEEALYAIYLEGVRVDTIVDNKIDILKKAAAYFKEKGQRDKEGDMWAKLVEVKPKPTLTDYFEAARSYYFGKKYPQSRDFALQMIEKYPAESFGYDWAYNNSQVMDTVKKDSIAVPDALKLFEFAQKDTVKFKAQYIKTARFLAVYYTNDARDKEKALEYLKKWQEADVANAPTIQQYIDQLQKSPAAKPGTPRGNAQPPRQGTAPKPTTKPATTTNKVAAVKK
jgi:Flp pilus assembly protein TadD